MKSSTLRWRSHVLLIVIAFLNAGFVLNGGMATRTVQAGGRDCGGTTGASLPTSMNQPIALQQRADITATQPGTAQTAESKTWAGQADFLPGSFERTEIITGTQQIALSRAWNPNFPIGAVSGPVTQDQPSLAALGNNLYGAWRLTRSGNGDIRAGSIDTTSGGALVNDDGGTAQQNQPSLVARSDGTLQAAWHDTRRDAGDIFASSSSDDGLTWGSNVRINDDDGSALQRSPSLVVALAGFCSCWYDSRNGHGDIYFSRSSNGSVWDENVRINDDAGTAEQDAPKLLASKQALYAIWQDGRNGNLDIYAARSDNSGASWLPNVRVNDDTGPGSQSAPAFTAAPDGTLVAVWLDQRSGAPELYWSRSRDLGASWEPNRKLAGDVQRGTQPAIAADASGQLFVVWGATSTAGDNIAVAHSIDGGRNWFVDASINDAAGAAAPNAYTSLATTSSRVLAAWDDDRNPVPSVFGSFWPARGYAPAGTYSSPVLDTRGQSAWGSLRWDVTPATNTAIAFEARAGNTLLPDATWSAWLPISASGAGLDDLPRARFFQWRATFSGPGPATPRLNSVTLTWESLIRARSFLPFMLGRGS